MSRVSGRRGRVAVRVLVDGKERDLGARERTGRDPPLPVRVDVRGAKELTLVVEFARFGDVQRCATAAAANAAGEARERAQAMAAESASGIPLELIALVTPLPADGGPVPGEIIEHQAHAIGHAAVLLADRGVLLAGDMLSDVLIPLLDPRRPGQVGAYEAALDRLDEAARHVDVLVPGHGADSTPAPRQEACTHCDFRPVCGPYEQERWQRDKEQAPLAALVALRERP